MQIAIDIRSTTKKKTGIGYYTQNLVENLAALDSKNQYALYSKVSYFNHSKKLLSTPGSNFKHFINRFGVSPGLLLRNVDIFHTSSYDIQKPKDAKLVVVVHDVIHRTYPDGHSPQTIKTIEDNLAKTLPETDQIIVPTNSTKDDFLRFYKFPSENISMIYPGIDEVFFQSTDRQKGADLLVKYDLNTPFILFIGTLEPRKNITGLIKAFDLLKKQNNIDHKLVIVGMRGWMYDEIFKTINELGLADEVVFTGYLAQGDIRCLLQRAAVFVYPSFYEGVGFPVLEAFASGTAVVTSDNSSLKEITKDCALLIDPNEPGDIADAILKVLTDNKLKEVLETKALERAKEFSWRRTAEKTLKVFERVTQN